MPTAPSGFAYYKSITISKTFVDSVLTNFPALVKITSDSDIGGRAASDGKNIRFALSDGTLLNYERQSFSVSGGAATGVFWVQVPSIDSSAGSDTVIYCWYDNSGASDGQNRTATWDTNFKGVWHLEADPSGTAPQEIDSTSNANDGTSHGSMTSGELGTGKVGNAITFDGSNDYLSLATAASLNITGSITLEGIIKIASGNSGHVVGGYSNSSPFAGYGFGVNVSSGLHKLQYWHGSAPWKTGTGSVDDSAYHHVAVSVSGTTAIFYIDGVQDASVSAGVPGSYSGSRSIGGRANDGASPFNGTLDEVRISSTNRSAAWLKFTYRNIFETDNCETWGTETNAGGGGIIPAPYYWLMAAQAGRAA